jgi:transposase-like protein
MKHYHLIVCPFCNNDDLVKNGHSVTSEQRWRCNKCKKSFQLEYKYNAWKPGVQEAIIEQTLNSSGVRDIGRNLKINKNTVVSVLKKNAK